MTIEEFRKQLKQNIEELASEREAETLIIAQDGIALVKLRIQTSGRDFELKPFKPYHPMTVEQRKAAGYQTDYVDFTQSGRMWASIHPKVIKNTAWTTEMDFEARTTADDYKLQQQGKWRGNILRLSEDEIQLLRDLNAERIQKKLFKNITT